MMLALHLSSRPSPRRAADRSPHGAADLVQARPPEPRTLPATGDQTFRVTPGDADPSLQLALEHGGVLLLPDRDFDLLGAEALLFGDFAGGRAKNISFDPRTGRLKAAGAPKDRQAALAAIIARYGDWAEECLREILPAYAPWLERGKASYRPRPAHQPLSPRKDDRRLHADAFPSQPVQGRRILRVFRNVHPAGQARQWRLGEDFEAYARRFLPRSHPPMWGEARLLRTLKITKGPRSPYDHLMLQLHDLAKMDDAYQASAVRRPVSFPPGATWIVFTDSTVHAAVGGRYAFEQTFFLPVEAMARPAAAPLRILERLTGHPLV